jgi:hypothetical protein
MDEALTNEPPWLDFSGAPPLMAPRRVVLHWQGTTDPSTGRYRELDTAVPTTDYDRACLASSAGAAILKLDGAEVLVLYSESDRHTWVSQHRMLACGGWIPSLQDLATADWRDGIVWTVTDGELLLFNSAADCGQGLASGDSLPLSLAPGRYLVEYATLESDYWGEFYRFSKLPPSA